MDKRIFDTARKEQGFLSQKHLDAFFAYYDHVQSCPECQKPGPEAFIDDGYQPTHVLCPKARWLDTILDKVKEQHNRHVVIDMHVPGFIEKYTTVSHKP